MSATGISGRAGRADAAGPDGILVLAKPPGPTSHDMVALVRRLAATRRVGHGGTLDPFASGVLPIFLGRATRVVEYHLADRKRYRATVCFGATSSTDDLEGSLEAVPGPPPDRRAVEVALGAFRGQIEQRPPAYSAIKIAGRRAYAMARAGERPELRPRTVTIHAIDLVEWDASGSDRPIAVIEVECSAGTYVRAIARDLGAAVGSGAYLGSLTRTASGPFRLEDAVSVDALRAAAATGPQRLRGLLLPTEAGLDRFPRVILEPPEVAAIARGQFVRPSQPVHAPDAPDGHFRLVDTDDRLVAIASLRDGRLVPEKVLVSIPSPTGDS
jgi:tRNA pseudouridine55 synthase